MKALIQSALEIGGDEEDRTPGLGIANAALSQLSYIPVKRFQVSGSTFQVKPE
jgi:hypothetical protein